METYLGTATADPSGMFAITTQPLSDNNYSPNGFKQQEWQMFNIECTKRGRYTSAQPTITTTSLTNNTTPTIEGIAEAEAFWLANGKCL